VEILCVDDDPLVLDGLRRQLRGHYEVVPATSGDEALRLLAEGRSFPVIVSDMRMPGMNGAALLSRTRELAPDMVRVLLTGHSDVHDTVAAVNEGNIFRFLLKPASQDSLLAALRDAAALHRTLVSERQLLQETLRGSLAALMEVLALASRLPSPGPGGSTGRSRS
jgi:DNA-binding NtrC family response regulator